MSYVLNSNQIAYITELKDLGEYHLAYKYIADQMKGAVQSGTVSRETQRWFEWAEQINGNYDTFTNKYARFYAQMGASKNGNILTDEDFQSGSDLIAEEVLRDILASGSIPKTPEAIILTDISRGSQEMGTDLEDFPGTLIANSLFDVDTFGNLILDPVDGVTWESIARGGEQLTKHLLILGSLATYGGRESLVDLLSDPRQMADVFDAAIEISNDPFVRDITGEIVDDLRSVLFDNLSDLYAGIKSITSWLNDVLSQFSTAQTEASPLVLDLDGDGVELTSLHGDGAVYWDVDQDGMAEASGWVAPDDGLLALDRNGNGAIDNHSELFGTESEDGFVMLSSVDSNGDGVIDAADTDFADLRVWQDANGDGISQADELHTLADLNISEISLNATAVEQLVNGNTIRSESTFTMNGQTYDIADAWFAYDDANTVFAGDYNLDVRTLFLPTARGYGDMPDLHIAAVNDNDFAVFLDCA